jgi:hypothetical protein
MKLIVWHQVLIGAAIALAAIFSARSYWLFWKAGAPVDVGMGTASIFVAAGLATYLRTVRAKWATPKTQPRA